MKGTLEKKFLAVMAHRLLALQNSSKPLTTTK